MPNFTPHITVYLPANYGHRELLKMYDWMSLNKLMIFVRKGSSMKFSKRFHVYVEHT